MEIIEEKKIAESVVGIKDAIKESSTDDTPIAITTEHGSHINGNPQKAMIKDDDVYSVEFWYPLDDERYSDYPQVEGKPFRSVVRRFMSEGISANKLLKLQSASLTIVQTMSKFIKDGKIEFPTDEEALELVNAVGTDTFEDACWVVAKQVLGLEEEERGNLYTLHLLNAVVEIISNNPEFFQVN